MNQYTRENKNIEISTNRNGSLINTVSFSFLLLFAILRPVSLLYVNYHILGFNILEIFAIVFSYIFIILIIINLPRFVLDVTSLSILFFCFYCTSSFLWGSQIREITRITLPFLLFFISRSIIISDKQIKYLIIALIIGFIIPITDSFYHIIKGSTIAQVVYQTTLDRHKGSFLGVHSLGHTMFLYSIAFTLFFTTFTNISFWKRFFLSFLLCVSIFCIYKTYVRTVYVGLFVFWSFYFIGKSIKRLLIFLSIIFILGSLYFINIKTIFWQTDSNNTNKSDLNKASSGRLFIWENNLTAYWKFDIIEKFVGIGLGNENRTHEQTHSFIISSHNDFLSLLMTLGIVGLFFYLVLFSLALLSITLSRINRQYKFIFIGFFFAILTMDFLSNSYINRFQLAQFQWMIAGIFFATKNIPHYLNR